MTKLTPNKALKRAIVDSEKTQRELAIETRIPETRLSHFVRGRVVPTDDEKKVLARKLKRSVDELFPVAVAQ